MTTPTPKSLTPGQAIAVTLSGGGTRLYAHMGVLEAIEAAQLKPAAVLGVSGGAVVAAAYAALGCEKASALLKTYPIDRAMRWGWLRNLGIYTNRDLATFARENGITWEAAAARGIDLRIAVTAMEPGVTLVWTNENHPPGVDLAEAVRISSSIPLLWGYTRMPTSMIDWRGLIPDDASLPPAVTLVDGGVSNMLLPGDALALPWVASNIAFNGYRTHPVSGLLDYLAQLLSVLQYRAMQPALAGAACVVKHRKMRMLGWIDKLTVEGIESVIDEARAEAAEELARAMGGDDPP